jgi:nucleotide-binding universal stress UspA family protein
MATEAAAFPVLIAADGSPTARAAVMTTLMFPWPDETEPHGVVALRTRFTAGRPGYVLEAFDRALKKTADDVQALLARRWPEAKVTVVDASPAPAILGEARHIGARVIVVGWRGHGPVSRLLLGSVSRAVVREAVCPVLVVNRRPKHLRQLVLGIDGSPNARRAVELIAKIPPPPGNSVTLVTALETISLPSRALFPANVRSRLMLELEALKGELAVTARRELDKAAATLRGANWRVRTILRSGPPLALLLATVKQTHGDVLIIGARGASGLDRLLLGSVAEGALNHCPVPVLVVR